MMDKLIEDYLSFKAVNEGRSIRTIEIYRLALKRLVLFFDKRDPLQATHDDLVLFTGVWLHKQGLRDAASRKTHVAAVRGFYAWCHSNRRISARRLSAAASRAAFPARGARRSARCAISSLAPR